MEDERARARLVQTTVDATFDRIARSEQTMIRAVDLLQSVQWYGSTLETQILLREQIAWLAVFIHAQSEQEPLDWLAISTPAPYEVEAVKPAPNLLYFPGVTASE